MIYKSEYGTLYAVRGHKGKPRLCSKAKDGEWVLSGTLAAAGAAAGTEEELEEILQREAKARGWTPEEEPSSLPDAAFCSGCLCKSCGTDCPYTDPCSGRDLNECRRFGRPGDDCSQYTPKSFPPQAEAEEALAPAEKTAPAAFDYGGLSEKTVATLQVAEKMIRDARKEYILQVADAVGLAHDELCGGVVPNWDNSKHGNRGDATFIAWCAYMGISKSTAYRLLQLSNLFGTSTPNEQKVLEAASPSLLYAAAKPSAPAQLVKAVKSGEITTHKQYKELEAQLKAEQSSHQQAAAERDAVSRRVQELEKQNAALKDNYATARKNEEFALRRVKELEERPVEVAVQQPDPAEVNRLAGQKAREMTEQLQAQMKVLQARCDRMSDEIENAYEDVYAAVSGLAVSMAETMLGMWQGLLAQAEPLTDEDWRDVVNVVYEAADRILQTDREEDDDEQE